MVRQMLRMELICNEDSDIHLFGLESFLTLVFHIIIILMLSIFLNNWIQTVFFIVAFFYLRGMTGGVHMKSDILCFIFSTILVFSLFYLKKVAFGPVENVSILFVCAIVHFFLAPVDNKVRTIDNREYQLFRRKMIHSLLSFLIIDLVIFFFQYSDFCYLLTYVLLVNSVSLVLGKYYRNRTSNIFL